MSTPTDTTATALGASARVTPSTPPMSMSMWSKMQTYATTSNHPGDKTRTSRTANECKFTGIVKRVATGRLSEVLT